MNFKKTLLLSLSLLLLNTPVLAVQGGENSSSDEEIGLLKNFLESDFIRTSVWPGIGPFHRAADDKQLVDPAGNQLTYSAEGKSINSCQLELHAGPNEGQSMLNLQMSVDFLLEGLGAKPAQIHLVNTEVSKNNKLLIGNNYNPIQASISPLVVSLQNLGVTEGTDSSIYRVVVVNKGQSSHSQLDENNTAKSSSISSENIKEKVNKVESSESLVPAKNEANNKDIALANEEAQPNAEVSQSSNITPAAKVVAVPKSLTKDEQLKKDFQDVIQNWQRLKKTAVKERDTSLLSKALAGKALIRQTDAIKWLASNHKYYEMTPGGAKIDKLTPLVAGKKYTVYAEVREKTKFMDESTNQVLKESDDTYKVNYTIEKIGEHWLITDSALTKSGADKSASEKTKKLGAHTPH